MIEKALIVSGGIVVLLTGLLILQKKKVVFWISFILTFLPLPYLTRYFDIEGPINFGWVNFFALAAIGVVISVFKVRKMYIPKSMLILYFGVLLVSAMSMVLNRSNVFSLIFAQRNYIMLFAYFAVFRLVLETYNKDEIMGFVANLGLASSFMAIFQRFVFVIALQIGSGDMVTGLFIDDGAFLYFQLISMCIVFVYWLKDHELPHLILQKPIAFFTMFMTLAVANNKAGLVLVILVMGLALIKMGPAMIIKHIGKIAVGIVAFMVILTIYEGYHNAAYGESADDNTYAENITDPAFWFSYLVGDGTDESRFSKSGSLKRGAAVVFAYQQIQKSPAHYFFGRGPGSTAQTSFAGATNFLDKLYPNWKVGRTSMSFFIAETGMLGMLINVIFVISLFFWRPPGVRREPSRFTITRQVFIILTIIYLFYENMYMLPVWALTIVVMIYPTYPKEVYQSSKQHKSVPEMEPHEKKELTISEYQI